MTTNTICAECGQPAMANNLGRTVNHVCHYPDGRRKGFTYGTGSGYEPQPLPGEPSHKLGDIPERADVFFSDWWGTPLPVDIDLEVTPEQAQAMIDANIYEWLRLAFKAGYKKAQERLGDV